MKANKNKYGFQKVLVSRRGGRKKKTKSLSYKEKENIIKTNYVMIVFGDYCQLRI